MYVYVIREQLVKFSDDNNVVITKLTAGKPRVSLFCGTRIANQKRDINPYQRENPNI